MINEEFIDGFFKKDVISIQQVSLLLDEIILYTVPVWHPLGFLTANIFENDVYLIKFHIWPKIFRKKSKNNWFIHSHNYNFLSKIILGELCHTTYNLNYSKETNHPYLLYDVLNNETGSILNQTAMPVSCEIDTTLIYQTNDIYTLSKHLFHSIVVPKDVLTVTLFKCYKPYQKASQVLGNETSNFEKKNVREKISKELFNVIITEILNSFKSK